MSGAAYRPADQKLVFHVTEKVSPQQTSVTNTYIPHQSSVSSNHSNNSTGSRRLLSTASSKQDSVQDVETNPTVRFLRVSLNIIGGSMVAVSGRCATRSRFFLNSCSFLGIMTKIIG